MEDNIKVSRIFKLLSVLTGAFVLAFLGMGLESDQPLEVGYLSFPAIFAVFLYVVGHGSKKRHEWARIAAVLTGIVLLPGIPLGTIFGIYLLKLTTRDSWLPPIKYSGSLADGWPERP